MLFYDCQPAPSPRRVRIFIAEKGLDIPTQQVDLSNNEQMSDEFRAKNPDCTVPALELDDGTVLSESLAICSYIEDLHPEPALIGRSPKERAEVLMWNSRIEQQGLAAVAESFRNHTKGFVGRAVTGPDDHEQIPALVPRGSKRAEAFLHRLDAHLKNREFIVGDNFSMADITALITVDMSGWIKLPIPEPCADLRRWHMAVAARPSAGL